MAYRRCLSARATLLDRRSSLSIGYISHGNDRDKPEELRSSGSAIEKYFTERRSFGSSVSHDSWLFRGGFCRQGSGLGLSGLYFKRYMSSSIREVSEKTAHASDIATVISDVPIDSVTSQLPEMSEVAIAAADSSYLIAALQHLIGGVQSLSGLNWWASIALTTFLIQGFTSLYFDRHAEYQYWDNFLIQAMKSMDPYKKKLDKAIEATVQGKASDKVRWELVHQALMAGLGRLGDTSPILPKGILAHNAVFFIFIFPILNMAEKVPSFKNGGSLWFTDLTTPDSMCIFPLLIALTCYARIELCYKGRDMKKLSRAMSICALLGALALNCPQAVYIHWLAFEIFSLVERIRKSPGVKKALGI